ncbi:MAG: YybH family protein [Bacillota bacterium]
MMRKSISTALLATAAAALMLGGCDKAQTKKAADPDSVKQAIKADEAKWNKDIQAKDTQAIGEHYADDSFFVAPGVAPTEGSTPIRQIFANASTDPAFELHFSADKIDVASSGDLAYSRGKFSEKYTDKKTGKVMSNSGTYLTVYKKQDDGSWKVVEDFAAADPDAAKPVPPAKPATRAKMVSF